ncbi:hypothetical protein [Crossiella sp. CA198]|uniref:hypothetical protein n=1 Tax=Crossiella sp. CA198 TaxID=3455607 RepID=UPI003F8D4E58
MPAHTTTTSAPVSAARRELLRAAGHEAGHAVLMAVLDFPLYEAVIGVSRPLFGRPQARGHVHETCTGQDEPPPEGQVQDAVLTYLAGAEAQARWMHQQEGMDLETARALAIEDYAGNDYATARTLLRRSGGSLGWATARTRALVTRHWPAITRVAQALVRHRRLTGPQIHRLIGR